jgi:antitoxin ChpS
MADSQLILPERAATGDPIVNDALCELDQRLRRRFGHKYVRLILFGSRARGDNAPDSDVDVAVVLRGPIENRWSVKRRIIEDTYPLLLATGLYIQPWPVSEGELKRPDRSPIPGLLRNILREGIPA